MLTGDGNEKRQKKKIFGSFSVIGVSVVVVGGWIDVRTVRWLPKFLASTGYHFFMFRTRESFSNTHSL